MKWLFILVFCTMIISLATAVSAWDREFSGYPVLYNDYQLKSGFDPNLIDFYQQQPGEVYAGLHHFRTGKYYGYNVIQNIDGSVDLGHIRTFTRGGQRYTVFIKDNQAPEITHSLEGHERISQTDRIFTFARARGYNSYRSEKRYIW